MVAYRCHLSAKVIQPRLQLCMVKFKLHIPHLQHNSHSILEVFPQSFLYTVPVSCLIWQNPSKVRHLNARKGKAEKWNAVSCWQFFLHLHVNTAKILGICRSQLLSWHLLGTHKSPPPGFVVITSISLSLPVTLLPLHLLVLGNKTAEKKKQTPNGRQLGEPEIPRPVACRSEEVCYNTSCMKAISCRYISGP